MINSLVPWRTFAYVHGQEHTVPGSTTNPACIYFTAENDPTATTQATAATVCWLDYLHLGSILNQLWPTKILTTNNFLSQGNIGWTTSDFRTRVLVRGYHSHYIRNASTEDVYITAYYCRARKDIARGAGLSNKSVYWFLAQGFAQSGLDLADNDPATNLFMDDAAMSPFNSFQFCSDFKITRTKQYRIPLGGQKNIHLRHRAVLLRPADLYCVGVNLALNADKLWSELDPRYNHHRHTRFVLFKMAGRPAGYGAAQSNWGKLIDVTTPTIQMESKFHYQCKIVPTLAAPSAVLSYTGFDPLSAHPPAVVVPGNAQVGVESDAK